MPETYQASPVVPENEAAILLAKGGWLPENAAIDSNTLDSVVRDYQWFFGLPVDGFIGPETYASLTAPRFCAHPDNYQPPLSLGGGINRWGKKLIKIEVVGTLGNLPDSEFRDGVITGARTWSGVCGIKFDLVQSGGDMVVDTGRIDGSGKTLAYFQLPSSDGFLGRLGGKFDDDENWPNILVAVAAHELGHGLGLGHTNVPNQLMNPILSRFSSPQEAWDIPQAIARYGHPKADTPEPPESPPPQIPVPESGWVNLGAGWKYRMPSTGGGNLELAWPHGVGAEKFFEQLKHARDSMNK